MYTSVDCTVYTCTSNVHCEKDTHHRLSMCITLNFLYKLKAKTAVILSPKEDKDRVPAMSENPLLTVETPSLLLDLLPSRSHDSDDSRLFCEEQLPLPVHQRRKLDFLDRRPAKPGQHFWEGASFTRSLHKHLSFVQTYVRVSLHVKFSSITQ